MLDHRCRLAPRAVGLVLKHPDPMARFLKAFARSRGRSFTFSAVFSRISSSMSRALLTARPSFRQRPGPALLPLGTELFVPLGGRLLQCPRCSAGPSSDRPRHQAEALRPSRRPGEVTALGLCGDVVALATVDFLAALKRALDALLERAISRSSWSRRTLGRTASWVLCLLRHSRQ